MLANIAAAEQKGRRRAVLYLLMAIALIAATAANSGFASERPMRLGTWLVMVALYALNLTPFATRRLRAPLSSLLNDETTQVYRQKSFVIGFWASLASAASVAIVASTMPVTAIFAFKVVIATGLVAALISFAVQELRAWQ